MVRFILRGQSVGNNSLATRPDANPQVSEPAFSGEIRWQIGAGRCVGGEQAISYLVRGEGAAGRRNKLGWINCERQLRRPMLDVVAEEEILQ